MGVVCGRACVRCLSEKEVKVLCTFAATRQMTMGDHIHSYICAFGVVDDVNDCLS